MFALDANVFIEAHRRYYGLDLCPGFWECLRHYGARQRLLSIDRVRIELLRGRDALSKWVKDSPAALFVSSAEPAVADAFADVMAWVQGNAQFRREAKAEFAAAADGWLAAYAKGARRRRGHARRIQSGRQAARAVGQRLSRIRRAYVGHIPDVAGARSPVRMEEWLMDWLVEPLSIYPSTEDTMSDDIELLDRITVRA